MTYIGKLAEVEGADPTAGAAVWRYVTTDHLGSVRALRNESRTALAQYEYEPYGGAFQFSGPTPDLGFTGHRWDAEAGMYYAPFRMYDPE